jgi:hypothetical protein
MMRIVFAFIAGLTIGALLLQAALAPRPCTCPDARCVGPIEIVPPPPRIAKPVEGIYL